MKAQLPSNEIERLAALYDLVILDTVSETSFNDIVKLAGIICKAPVALISLVDSNRQWFKACIGLDVNETSRDLAFCAHAILQPNELMIVEDAQLDPRFSDNPLVTGAPGIRFYTGAPLLTTTGMALGTLCVIDYQPRVMDEEKKIALAALARQVMQLFDLHSTNQTLERSTKNLQLMADNLPALIGQLNKEQRYIFCNNKYREWLGIEPDFMLGKKPREVLSPDLAALATARLDRCYAGETEKFDYRLPDGRIINIQYVPQRQKEKIIGMFIVATDVTTHQQQQLMLEQERENLDMVIKGTNIGTWKWNVQSGEVFVNERWAEIIGYKLNELGGINVDTWLKLLHEDDLQKSTEMLNRHFDGELDYYDYKCRLKHKAGHWVWVHERGQLASRTQEGEPLFMFGTQADITELQEFQEKLQESETRLQSMISNFPGAVYRCENNEHWSMHYLSQTVEQLTGYSLKEFFDPHRRSFTDIIHPEDSLKNNRQVQEALSAKKSFDLIYRFQRADGSWRWAEEMGVGIYDEHGKVKFIDGFIWDITEAEEHSKTVALKEKKLSSLYNLSPVAIALNSFEDGRFIEGNPELYRMTGYTEAEFCQLSYWDITPEHYADEEQKQLELLRVTGRYGPYEKQYIHKSGHLIPVLLSGVLIEDVDGEQKIWSIIQDITERKRIEQMKNEFVSSVSHELRTPLTSISASLGMLANGMLGSVPEKMSSVIDIAYKNSQRLSVLINDLLDMEKLLAGKMDFDIRLQLLHPIVDQSLKENKAYADGFAVEFALIDNAPPVSVAIDAQRLLQVLANFLSNAVKFSPANSKVDIKIDVLTKAVKISVIDCGPGINEDFRAHIFQKFSQADASDSRQRGGTGLGLAISKELVERMNGEIGFTSVPGKGATFFAIFPTINVEHAYFGLR